MVTGGAQLSTVTAEFLTVCFGVPIIQGYGLTETCGASSNGEVDCGDMQAKIIGAPTMCAEMKLVDERELDYTTDDKPCPRGEIWIRGYGIAKGYYKNPEKTKEDFEEDGWFKSGDIGQINPNGTFTIIDRKKNLVKPPHGEYVAPERLESVYKNADFIDTIMVYAGSDHNELIALVHPSKDLAQHVNKNADNWEALVASPEAEKAVLESLGKVWKSANLKSVEKIHAVKLFAEEWTPENGWMTAAMKLRRQEMQKVHAKLIKEIYSKLVSE